MYADDILLLSASVCGLQKLLDKCFDYCVEVGLSLNARKSYCMIVGSTGRQINGMTIGGQLIEWTASFKYLGVTFMTGKRLRIDCAEIRRKFYAACNGLLYRCSQVEENIRLFLMQVYCLPLLTYCLGAFTLSQKDIVDISVCWNDAFRRIYGMHRWESVAPLQFYTNNLSLKLIYHYHTWNFIEEIREDCNGTVPAMVKFVYETRKYEHELHVKFGDMYNYYGRSKTGRRVAITNAFAREIV
jgi:hypothetical protein